jgi:hypothetical protein
MLAGYGVLDLWLSFNMLVVASAGLCPPFCEVLLSGFSPGKVTGFWLLFRSK